MHWRLLFANSISGEKRKAAVPISGDVGIGLPFAGGSISGGKAAVPISGISGICRLQEVAYPARNRKIAGDEKAPAIKRNIRKGCCILLCNSLSLFYFADALNSVQT